MVDQCANTDCIHSKDKIDFEEPEDLLENIVKGNVVLFTGAGISTEKRHLLPYSFYEMICNEIGHTEKKWSFPKVMTKYCERTDGRIKLIEKIRERFDYINSFTETKDFASKFHRELATIPMLSNIVTTNWDTLFEDECGAIPFIKDEDIMLWDIRGRKVIKIHGSIDNIGSVVATEEDYRKCRKTLNSGVIGSILKNLLATKTIVYIGYSLNDDDFNFIRSFVQRLMKGYTRQAYIVTLDTKNKKRFEKLGLIPIVTDATYFISTIKNKLVKMDYLQDDSIYEYAVIFKELVELEHLSLFDNFNCYENPSIIYCAIYQDGMIHALQRAIEKRKTGEYSEKAYLHKVANVHDDMKKGLLKKKMYNKYAYLEGYTNGLIALGIYGDHPPELIHPPLYFAYGVKGDLMELDDYKEVVPVLKDLHKTSYSLAKKHIGKSAPNSETGIVFHQPPPYII